MEVIINRNAFLEELYQSVISRKNVQLFGGAGVGKSYLTRQLISKLHQRRICFYFSFRGLRSLEDFAFYYQQILQQASKDYPTVAYHLGKYFSDFPVNQLRNWEQWLVWHNGLTQVLVKLSQDLLFVLDHLDEWEVEGAENFPQEAMAHLNPAPNCQWLFIQKEALANEEFLCMEVLPLAINEIEYDALKQTDAEALVQFTRGNTKFLVELIALEGEFNTRKQIFMKSVHARFYFFKTRFTQLQWNLLRAIALEENVEQPMAFEFLMKYRLGAASSIDRALTNLVQSKIVHKTADGYTLTNTIMLRWFQWLYTAA